MPYSQRCSSSGFKRPISALPSSLRLATYGCTSQPSLSRRLDLVRLLSGICLFPAALAGSLLPAAYGCTPRSSLTGYHASPKGHRLVIRTSFVEDEGRPVSPRVGHGWVSGPRAPQVQADPKPTHAVTHIHWYSRNSGKSSRHRSEPLCCHNWSRAGHLPGC